MPEPLTHSALRSIDAGGSPLSYVESGDGPVLLLVHGSLCDLRYWRWQIPAFGRHFRVIAPSLRGYWPHAFELADPTFNLVQHAADLEQLIDEVAGRPVHLLGHSRGARVALELAARTPGRIASLILADPGLQTVPSAAAMAFQRQAVDRLAMGDVEGALQGFIDTVNGADTWRRMTGWFKEMVRDNAATLFSQAAEQGTVFETSRIQPLRCPVLLLGGEHSPPRFARAMDSLQAVLTQAERDVIPMASHGMNLGNARAFNARVERFVLRAHAQA